MSKSPQMEKFLDSLAKDIFGNSRKESFKNKTCVICSGAASEFRDDLSAKEYTISGMCQKCQDETFGV